jgi:hypothetical protein
MKNKKTTTEIMTYKGNSSSVFIKCSLIMQRVNTPK